MCLENRVTTYLKVARQQNLAKSVPVEGVTAPYKPIESASKIKNTLKLSLSTSQAEKLKNKIIFKIIPTNKRPLQAALFFNILPEVFSRLAAQYLRGVCLLRYSETVPLARAITETKTSIVKTLPFG